MQWAISDILQATGGEQFHGTSQCRFSGISIDSRTIATGHLFVAIEGDTHDGHRFIGDVIKIGAKGIVVSKAYVDSMGSEDRLPEDVASVAVDDTTTALGDLAAFVREQGRLSVVAITGSNGKTTTRGMVSAILERSYSVLSTQGNFNNLIGLPLTLLRRDDTHDWAVLELGMNQPGEIGRLGRICRPDIGVITNIGPVHLEGLASLEGVMQAKGELIGTLRPEGILVVNGDDRRTRLLGKQSSCPVLTFGRCRDADIQAREITATAEGTAFELVLPRGRMPVHLKPPGEFMVSNALAAAAVGYHAGLGDTEIRSGLEAYLPDKGRMNIVHTRRGIHLIDDSYNANPTSMRAAIHALDRFSGDGRSVVVAGDMLELGSQAPSLHREIGAAAAESGIARLYVAGAYSDAVAAGAVDTGMASETVFLGTPEDIVRDLVQWLEEGDWVLIKGSRKMKMEQVFQELKGWADGVE